MDYHKYYSLPNSTVKKKNNISLDNMHTTEKFEGKYERYKYVSKVGNHSWGWPEGSLFNSYYTKV